MTDPLIGSLEYHYCTTSQRMRWLLSLPGSCLDHMVMGQDRADSLNLLREINARRTANGLGNIYVRGL